MPAALKVNSGNLKIRVMLLPQDGSAFLLGRSLEAHLILQGPGVRERHVALLPEGDGHKLVPMGRKGETRVGGTLVRDPLVLNHGDLISIGKHELRYMSPYQRETISYTGSGRVGSEIPCTTCSEPIGAESGKGSLQALRLGKQIICPRCVDLRLHADRDLESYRILRKVNTNEEEVTYLAVDHETSQKVAIRILKADRQARPRVFRRFLVRALTGLVLNHQNYLEVQGIRSSKGITYVVLEHLEQSTKLEAMVRERSPMSAVDALYVTNQLAEVLRYARERQLVVAKRKKSGVLVDKNSWVQVLAYDVTTQLEEQVARTEAFRDLAIRSDVDPDLLATAHLEPRNEDEKRQSTLASEFAEVYSVGRILFQMIAGNPFTAGSIDAVAHAWRQVRQTGAVSEGPLAGSPGQVVGILEHLLVPRGKNRIRTLVSYTQVSKEAYSQLVGLPS